MIRKLWRQFKVQEFQEWMSYVGKAYKQGYNAYEAIKNAISGQADFIFEQGGF